MQLIFLTSKKNSQKKILIQILQEFFFENFFFEVKKMSCMVSINFNSVLLFLFEHVRTVFQQNNRQQNVLSNLLNLYSTRQQTKIKISK